MAMEDGVQNILASDDGEIIALLVRQEQRNFFGGDQVEVFECDE